MLRQVFQVVSMFFGEEFRPSLQPSPPSFATIPAELVSCPATPVPKYQNNAEVDLNFFFYQVPPLHAALWQSRSEPVKTLRWRCDERA
jgi:hypothetical protein